MIYRENHRGSRGTAMEGASAASVKVPIEAWPRRGDWKGRVTRLLRREGDVVNEGDELAEVEIEKAVLVIEAPTRGVVRYKVSEGSEVTPDTVIAVIEPIEGGGE